MAFSKQIRVSIELVHLKFSPVKLFQSCPKGIDFKWISSLNTVQWDVWISIQVVQCYYWKIAHFAFPSVILFEEWINEWMNEWMTQTVFCHSKYLIHQCSFQLLVLNKMWSTFSATYNFQKVYLQSAVPKDMSKVQNLLLNESIITILRTDKCVTM